VLALGAPDETKVGAEESLNKGEFVVSLII
jgi:hypothetical protein